MRVFVTGASGHIGSALVPELLAAGHEVVGLARSDDSAARLQAAGAEVHAGSVDDLDSLRKGAGAADGVVHLAYKHDLSLSGSADGFVAAGEADLLAVEAIGAELAGSGRPFVIAGGTLLLAQAALGRAGTEDDRVETGTPPRPRIASENAVVALADVGVRSSVVRLAPVVHSALDRHGFVPMLVEIARRTGVAAYVGDGANRWPAVHTLDAARLFRLAVEAAPAGSRLHGAADEGVPFRDVAGVIGRRLGLPTVSLPAEDAPAHFGFLGHIAGVDNPTSSARTRAMLGWQPAHAGLIADLEQGHYFEQ